MAKRFLLPTTLLVVPVLSVAAAAPAARAGLVASAGYDQDLTAATFGGIGDIETLVGSTLPVNPTLAAADHFSPLSAFATMTYTSSDDGTTAILQFSGQGQLNQLNSAITENSLNGSPHTGTYVTFTQPVAYLISVTDTGACSGGAGLFGPLSSESVSLNANSSTGTLTAAGMIRAGDVISINEGWAIGNASHPGILNPPPATEAGTQVEIFQFTAVPEPASAGLAAAAGAALLARRRRR